MLMATHLIGFGSGKDNPITSYSNTGGQGDRTAIITVTSNVTPAAGTLNNLVDGAVANNSTDSIDFSGGGVPDSYIRFDFSTPVYIDEITINCSGAPANGTWTVRVSNDLATFLQVASFNWDAATETDALAGMQPEGYRYLDLFHAGATTMDPAPWYREVTFKIAPGA